MTLDEKTLLEIPGPQALPVVGSALSLEPGATLQSFITLGQQYSPIYRLYLGNTTVNLINTRELVDEVCDEKRFKKIVSVSINKLRQVTHDGLFTAHHEEPNWGIAHRILMPVFGPIKIKEIFPEMKDIAQQLCLKWARYGDGVSIPVTDDFTRLTLDTIALCAMDFRFNSFYKDGELHPFVQSMGNALTECERQSQRPDMINAMRWQAQKELQRDNEIMHVTSMEIIKRRRERPVDAPDLLNSLLHGRDPKTGKGLSDDNIVANMITFLIAGHETTSGLLSFAFYYMLKEKDGSTLKRARQEIDDVVGTDPVSVEHLGKLPYINAILRETLRLQPTAPIFSVTPFKDEVIGGKYLVKEGDPIFCVLHNAHRDKAVFGEDAETFRAERMLDENFSKLPSNSWKPFGNGMRACIGRAFAWQEALLVIALLLQNFDFKMADPSYELRVKESLTIKPDGFEIYTSLRRHGNPTELLSALGGSVEPAPKKPLPTSATGNGTGKPMTILYGSNSGSCEALARRLAGNAASKGYSAKTVAALDSAADNLPSGQPVVIITASYDGQPAENAAKFVAWLESLEGTPLKGVTYAVFGCGHRDWASTFYRIPTLIDQRLEATGATRLAAIGAADAAVSDLFSDLEGWEDGVFWPALPSSQECEAPAAEEAIRAMLQVEILEPRRAQTYEQLAKGVVAASTPIGSRKQHVEIRLPAGAAYVPGDHLQVLPVNPPSTVQRALARFQLSADSVVKIARSSASTTMPADSALTAGELLSAYVELAQTASPRDVRVLAAATTHAKTKAALEELATTRFAAEIRDRRVSVLDLLERHFAVALPFGAFLSLLSRLRLRTYSISSAPAWTPGHASLTVSVVVGERSDGGGRQHLGVASNYLARLAVGDIVYIAPRSTKDAFHMPADATPIAMVAAGSGIAPFRGFVQQRALALRAGASLAPALLVFGCREPGVDDLYREELDEFEAQGAVKVYRAYSRRDGGLKTPGEVHGYVQDALLACGGELRELWKAGGKVYVCGSSKMAADVKRIVARAVYEGAQDVSDDVTLQWFKQFQGTRYVAEIFT